MQASVRKQRNLQRGQPLRQYIPYRPTRQPNNRLLHYVPKPSKTPGLASTIRTSEMSTSSVGETNSAELNKDDHQRETAKPVPIAKCLARDCILARFFKTSADSLIEPAIKCRQGVYSEESLVPEAWKEFALPISNALMPWRGYGTTHDAREAGKKVVNGIHDEGIATGLECEPWHDDDAPEWYRDKPSQDMAAVSDGNLALRPASTFPVEALMGKHTAIEEEKAKFNTQEQIAQPNSIASVLNGIEVKQDLVVISKKIEQDLFIHTDSQDTFDLHAVNSSILDLKQVEGEILLATMSKVGHIEQQDEASCPIATKANKADRDLDLNNQWGGIHTQRNEVTEDKEDANTHTAREAKTLKCEDLEEKLYNVFESIQDHTELLTKSPDWCSLTQVSADTAEVRNGDKESQCKSEDYKNTFTLPQADSPIRGTIEDAITNAIDRAVSRTATYDYDNRKDTSLTTAIHKAEPKSTLKSELVLVSDSTSTRYTRPGLGGNGSIGLDTIQNSLPDNPFSYPMQRSREDQKVWYYKDMQECVLGPFSSEDMYMWYQANYFPPELLIRCGEEAEFVPLAEFLGSTLASPVPDPFYVRTGDIDMPFPQAEFCSSFIMAETGGYPVFDSYGQVATLEGYTIANPLGQHSFRTQDRLNGRQPIETLQSDRKATPGVSGMQLPYGRVKDGPTDDSDQERKFTQGTNLAQISGSMQAALKD